jgi:hypothetical protein
MNKIMNSKMILAVLIFLSVATTASAGDLGFDDFIPPDPIQDLKDVGVYDLVLKILGLLAAFVIVAVVAGLIIGVGKTSFHTAANNSTGRTDAMIGMFFILGAVLVMVMVGGVFFYIWNGLT